MNFLYLMGVILALACHKTDPLAPVTPPDPPPTDTITAPAQYGTPYAQVPDPYAVIMYQVNFRAFSTAGNFAGVQARLDSIRALGVNTLYMMPVYPVGVLKSVNSPYCIKDFMGVNSEFGTLDGLRTLVSEAHKRNMAVLFDWVADHSSWDNAWTSNKAWYKQDGAGNIIPPPNTGWNDVAALNYLNTDLRKAMIRAMQYWVYQANIDGYRCDAADFLPFDFWHQAIDSLRAIPGHKLLLFAEGSRKDHFSAGFQLEYGMGFYYNLVNTIYGKQGSVQSIDSVNQVEYTGAGANDRIVRYTSNHDVDNSDGTPLDLLGGKAGSLAAFVVSAYIKGVPMLYNGQEVGCPVKLNYFNNSTTIDWTLNPDMKAEYKRLLAFRNSSGALQQGDLVSYNTADVCVFTRTYNQETLLVIVNLRNAAASYTMPAALTGAGVGTGSGSGTGTGSGAGISWTNVFDGRGLNVDGQGKVNLQAYQYVVLKKS